MGAGISEELLPHLDLQQVSTKAKKLEDELREEVKRYGVGVTERMQEVFDVLAKTHDAVWEGQDIVLPALNVRVSNEGQSIEGGTQTARERLEKVLNGGLERQRN